MGPSWSGPLTNLFRMQNVVTRRRERINSDEEERQRSGFELRTGIRFADGRTRAGSQTAQVRLGEETVATFTYGDAATIWRINLGWRRRKDHGRFGYVLDLDSGRWLSETDLDQGEDPLPSLDRAKRVERVVPYVEDTRNCLLVEPHAGWDDGLQASLMAALKTAIQAEFQLEDAELAAEPLPSGDDRRSILYYEAAEGGAGVLRRLLTEPDALGRVVRRALDVCHLEPTTGADLGRAPGAREDCEAACYGCLMSYRNQRDHRLLDRHRAAEVLLAWREASVRASPEEAPREDKLAELLRGCDSELEREWLTWVHGRGAALPSHAQKLIASCSARPDFLYAGAYTAVWIDGPHHNDPAQAARDAEVDLCLADLGYVALRFRYDDRESWEAQVHANPSAFGPLR